MSEESSITVEQKEKNPKRVEGGKRLAAYNKAAREKMNAVRVDTSVENMPTNTKGIETEFLILPLIGIVGVVGLAAYFYFTQKSDKTVVKDTEDDTKQEQPKSRLRSLD